MLRECHGLDGLSAVGSLQASARSKSVKFMGSRRQQVGLPAMRMRIKAVRKAPVLSFTVSADRPAFRPAG